MSQPRHVLQSRLGHLKKSVTAKGQKVLYVTERCVFRLEKDGLVLFEVYDGIDIKRDILDLLEFKPILSEKIKDMI